MTESPDENGPGKTYRMKGALRPAQHRFLMLGIVLIIVIAAILAVLNQSVKEETKLEEQMQVQMRTGTLPAAEPQTGLAYDAAPPTDEPVITPAEPVAMPENAPADPNPPADVSVAPTTEALPSE